MVWAIEQLVNGEWQFFRYSDHQVVTFRTQRDAVIEKSRLDAMTRTQHKSKRPSYRVTQVRD